MLINLRSIHRPATLDEAAQLLAVPGNYPIYGGGASVIRANWPDLEGVVDLSGLVNSANEIDSAGDLLLGPASTLEAVLTPEIVAFDAKIGGGISDIVRAEMPQVQRNGMCVADVLMESNPCSPLLLMLTALQTDLNVLDSQSHSRLTMRMRDWFTLSPEVRRSAILIAIQCRSYTDGRYAFEKVSRTPLDMPIVAALAFCPAGTRNAHAIIGGLTDHPARYVDGMQSTISDYRGSTEYRTAMAHILNERATARAIALAQ